MSNTVIFSFFKKNLHRACVFCHFCQNNCFFILLSWMPTYFHDNFPQAQSWIFNVIPWMLMIPGVIIAGWFSNRLIHKGYTVGQTRKICESLCGCTEAFCLICIGNKSLKISIRFSRQQAYSKTE